MPARLEVVVGRIETLALDAVVNAANSALVPGTGVDGALRAAAGPALTEATRKIAPLATGEAALTPGFAAPARHIIHTVAPIWFVAGAEADKVALLARCYRNVIALAHAHGLSSLAFPCLGAGNFGWPRELACETAIAASRAGLNEAPSLSRLVFCCFTEADGALYRAALTQS